jgi:hypothetical protein
MSAIPYESQTQDWDAPGQQQPTAPGRLRRQFFNRKTAALAAVVACVTGFYAGISIEKGQLAGTASAATTSATGAAAVARTGAGTAGGFPGAGRFGGAGGSASAGTISNVNGNTIYFTDSSGNTVKVTLSSGAKLAKSLSVSKNSLHPGDAIVVQGVKNSSGTIVATSVSDSGANATGSGASTRGSATSGSSTTS